MFGKFFGRLQQSSDFFGSLRKSYEIVRSCRKMGENSFDALNKIVLAF